MVHRQGPVSSRQVTWKAVVLSALLLGAMVGLLLRLVRQPLPSGANGQHWHVKALSIMTGSAGWRTADRQAAQLQQLVRNLSTGSALEASPALVIMTIVDTDASQFLLPRFADSLCRANSQLFRQLLVVCVSAEAYSACLKTGATCYHDKEAEQRNARIAMLPPIDSNGTSKAPKRVQTPLFLQIGWDKLDALHTALSQHAMVLFADSDILWLMDPLPVLQASKADVQLTGDGWGPNIGVMFVRPTAASLIFMEKWRARRTAPHSRDQYEFTAAVNQTRLQANLSVQYFNKLRFPNGCCCGFELPRSKARAKKWILWHAACVGGSVERKAVVLERIERAAARLRPSYGKAKTCRQAQMPSNHV